MIDIIIKIILIWLAVATSCFAEEILPTETDLKAAYCRADLQYRLNEYQSMSTKIPQSIIGPVVSNLNRINGYLISRLVSLDIAGLITAARSAGDDEIELRMEVKSCFSKVGNRCQNSGNYSEYTSCQNTICDSNNPSQAVLRVRLCNDTSWLPY